MMMMMMMMMMMILPILPNSDDTRYHGLLQ